MAHSLEFRLSENPWAPTAVIEQINARTGSGLVLTGLADQVGGVSSAAFVAWPDGRQSALTRPHTPLPLMRLTATVVNAARAQGLPVPQHQLVLPLDDGYVAVVQERLPGRHAQTLDPTTVAAFVAMNERFAGLLRRYPQVPAPAAFPLGDGGYGVFEQTLGAHSRRARQLLTHLLDVDGGAPFRMRGDDLVHVDYSPGNVLFGDDGQVTGVVDWNFGAARGDRRYALIGLRWGSVGRSAIKPAERAVIDAALADLDPDTRRRYKAHWLVHMVHHSIAEGFSTERIESDIAFAEDVLD